MLKAWSFHHSNNSPTFSMRHQTWLRTDAHLRKKKHCLSGRMSTTTRCSVCLKRSALINPADSKTSAYIDLMDRSHPNLLNLRFPSMMCFPDCQWTPHQWEKVFYWFESINFKHSTEYQSFVLFVFVTKKGRIISDNILSSSCGLFHPVHCQIYWLHSHIFRCFSRFKFPSHSTVNLSRHGSPNCWHQNTIIYKLTHLEKSGSLTSNKKSQETSSKTLIFWIYSSHRSSIQDKVSPLLPVCCQTSVSNVSLRM